MAYTGTPGLELAINVPDVEYMVRWSKLLFTQTSSKASIAILAGFNMPFVMVEPVFCLPVESYTVIEELP